LGVIHVLKIWKHYFSITQFTIETDRESLKYLTTQPNLSRRQCRWVERLQQFDFGQSMQHVKGKKNVRRKEKIFLARHEKGMYENMKKNVLCVK
jgi:hypothetical protein